MCGVVHTRKHAGGVWRTLGCVAHKDRGDAICSNGYTISDPKVTKALVDHSASPLVTRSA